MTPVDAQPAAGLPDRRAPLAPRTPTAALRPLAAVAALLAVCAAGAALANLPAGLTAPLAAAAWATTAWLVVPRRWGAVDALAVAVGGALTGLVLLGTALDVLPTGITRPAWVASVAVLELAALAIVAIGTRRARAAGLSAAPVRELPRLTAPSGRATAVGLCYLAAAVLTGAAVTVAVQAAHRSEIVPVELSLQGTRAAPEVVLTADVRSGPYNLVAVEGATVQMLLSDLIVKTGQSVTVLVRVPAGHRVQVRLAKSDDPTRTLRELVIER